MIEKVDRSSIPVNHPKPVISDKNKQNVQGDKKIENLVKNSNWNNPSNQVPNNQNNNVNQIISSRPIPLKINSNNLPNADIKKNVLPERPLIERSERQDKPLHKQKSEALPDNNQNKINYNVKNEIKENKSKVNSDKVKKEEDYISKIEKK